MFHVGQKIVCVNNDPSYLCFPANPPRLVKGGIYTIDQILTDSLDDITIMLVEIESEGPEWVGFDPNRFRPIHDTKSEISFTTGADPDSDKWDNRVKRRERV